MKTPHQSPSVAASPQGEAFGPYNSQLSIVSMYRWTDISSTFSHHTGDTLDQMYGFVKLSSQAFLLPFICVQEQFARYV